MTDTKGSLMAEHLVRNGKLSYYCRCDAKESHGEGEQIWTPQKGRKVHRVAWPLIFGVLFVATLLAYLIFYYVSLSQVTASCATQGMQAVSTSWWWICVEGKTP